MTSMRAAGETPRGANFRPLSNSELAGALCEGSVSLREAHRLHLATYDTLVPHVFMSDVLARVGQCLAAVRADASATHAVEVESIMATLERGLADGERETRNVIALSFARDSELEIFFPELRAVMGPRARTHLQGR